MANLELGRFTKDTTITVIRQGLALLIGIGTSVIISRALGPEGRGMYILAILVPSLVMMFMNAGVTPATIYYIGKGNHSAERIAGSNVVMGVITGFISLVVVGVVAILWGDILLPGLPIEFLILASIAIPFSLIQSYLSAVLLGLERINVFNTVSLARSLLNIALMALVLFVLGWGIAGALIVLFLVTIIILGLTAIFVNREIGALVPRLDIAYVKDSIGYGLKTQAGNIAGFLNYRLDVFLVNIILGSAAVGVYGVASGIGEKIWVLSFAVSTVMFPRVASMKSEASRREFTPIISRNVFMLSILGGLVLWIIAPWVIPFLYTEEFAAAATALRFLIPGIVVLSASRVLSNDIAARGRPMLNTYIGFVMVILNVVCNIILIPRMGINGAALASTISYSTNGLLRLLTYSRLSGNRPIQVVFPQKSDLILYRKLIMRTKRSIRVRVGTLRP